MKGLSRGSTEYASGGYHLLEYLQCLSLRVLFCLGRGWLTTRDTLLLGISEGFR